ncbi:6-carboxytetrahydropterin synthase [Breoghania sp.]|uniref:6-pyruvoyl trahydropterin synthase family protein n=1 Tax=Breoghania sp. TaxID=2065378 RepID=UPI0029CA1B1F|nr:6-carboxytetrahydropterin synthase [Breoghania sp.]
MFAVEVRDHIMIAHSFRGAMFGPAQAMHGATFVVDAAFFARTLDENGVVIDIGRAHEALKSILTPLNYRNLDEVEAFRGLNTTTEFLTRHIHEKLSAIARTDGLGRAGVDLDRIRVTLSESHVARAWYEAGIFDDAAAG